MHADFEMWSRHPKTREPIPRQFPNPKRPKSSQQAAIEGLAQNLRDGSQSLCPGEFGRESLETAIGLRESHRRGGEKVELPLGRPNSGDRWTRLRIGSSTSLPISIEGLKLVSGTYRVRGNRTGISNLIWYPFLLSTSLFSYKFHIYLTPSFVLRF